MTKQYYVGTDLKFQFEITSGNDFDQENDPYTIELRCGGVTKELNQDDIIHKDGHYYLLVDTRGFHPGVLTATVRAAVSDGVFPEDSEDDFLDYQRREVAVVELCYLKEPWV